MCCSLVGGCVAHLLVVLHSCGCVCVCVLRTGVSRQTMDVTTPDHLMKMM